ncbi:MAG: hypothetical protein V7K23_28025 [Nostoc sp.]
MTFDFPVLLLYETLRERGSKLRAASRREGADLHTIHDIKPIAIAKRFGFALFSSLQAFFQENPHLFRVL